MSSAPTRFTNYGQLRTTLVVNDELVRHGLMHVVSRIEGIQFVGDLRPGQGLTERIRSLRPDLVVLGVIPGLDLARLLSELDFTPKVVVVIDGQDDRTNAIGLLRAGADALVDRRSTALEMRNTMIRVINGSSALDTHCVNALIAELRCPPVSADNEAAQLLTSRERDVMNLLVEGLDNRTIGNRLFIAEATVKFHLHNIMNKFGVHKRAALIAVALRRHDPALSS